MELSTIKEEYGEKKFEIGKRLKEYTKVESPFYELCFCLLTPQSNAFQCDRAIQELISKNYKEKEFDTKDILIKYTRFYRNKSIYLKEFREKHTRILSELKNIKDNNLKRTFLVTKVKGLGLKEASHYLRNTGHRNLAILDRHILKNLVNLGVINEIPKSLTPKLYFYIEEKFQDYANKIGISMDELDLLFWSMQTGKVFK